MRRKIIREGITFYLATGRNLCYLVQVGKDPGTQGPDSLRVEHFKFGIVTLHRFAGDARSVNKDGEERFAITFR